MKRLLLVLLLCTTPLLAACPPRPVTIVTPQGQAAYTADQVAVRISELQNAAIAANASGNLPTGTTRTIVQFCVTAAPTLASVPAGWNATLQAAWAAAKAQIPPVTNPAIVAAMAAVDVVLGVTQ
jgi:hypothetical protein